MNTPTDDLYPADPPPETADEVMSEAYVDSPEGFTLRRLRGHDDTFSLTSPGGVALTMTGVEGLFGDLSRFDWAEHESNRDGSTRLVAVGSIREPEGAVDFAKRWVAKVS